MRKAIECSLLSIIASKENTNTIRRKEKGSARQNSKTYSAVVLEGNKLDEAIQKANTHDEFDYIIDALKPARSA